ncbi:MAG: DUF1566 domain-containing protein [Actinobacteria bacterium]|nr:DUF1566 domain-containing protein [Actinomycetota bacterium]
MRRLWIPVISVVVALALTACGCCGGNESTRTATESQQDEAEIVPEAPSAAYPVVDTGQASCYDNAVEISPPGQGQPFYGQDAQHECNQPSYRDNGNGTVTDLVTGLMWQQDPGEKKTYAEAAAGAEDFSLAGYDDWRLPTIKELYSLILFSGLDPSPEDPSGQVPFIDTDYFDFNYGDVSAGERIIDSQWASSTECVNTTMDGNQTVFGVNFADGRIKGYPTAKEFYCIYVRGNTSYGENDFTGNGDGTVTDEATGLMWSQNDSGEGKNWEEALAWVQEKNAEGWLGYSDWRLPDAKELQSIVDYSRSPATTNSAAIDPVFNCTSITNEAGQPDYPWYWTGTTHASSRGGEAAAYVAFGRALGNMHGQWVDVHGAGCQRSDPKAGDPAEYPEGRGPQGDAIRIYNYVRLVRG